METKEFKIQVPDGYEIDKENSTFECIKFKPIDKKLTYEDVAKELFIGKVIHYTKADGEIANGTVCTDSAIHPNNCTTRKQAEKLLAINKLMNVAKFLNKRREPNGGARYYFSLQYGVLKESFTDKDVVDFGVVYFYDKEDLAKAEQILGEETIKLALSTDW